MISIDESRLDALIEKLIIETSSKKQFTFLKAKNSSDIVLNDIRIDTVAAPEIDLENVSGFKGEGIHIKSSEQGKLLDYLKQLKETDAPSTKIQILQTITNTISTGAGIVKLLTCS